MAALACAAAPSSPASPGAGRYALDRLPPFRNLQFNALRAARIGTETSYVAPTRETAELLARHGAHRLLEIGAGSGMMAARLREAGFDIIASDAMLPAFETGRNPYRFQHGMFHPVLAMDGATAIATHPDRDILLAMPGPEDLWYAEAIKAIAPGRRLFLNLDGKHYWDPEDPKEQRPAVAGSIACLRTLRTHFRHLDRARFLSFGNDGWIEAYERLSQC